MPNLHLYLGADAWSTNQGHWLGAGYRNLSKARRAARGRVRECHAWAARDSSWGQAAILVLWVGLQPKKADCVPEPTSKAEGGTVAGLYFGQDHATGV